MRIEQMSPLVLPLADAGATLPQVGGKGTSLARLAAAGLPVPPGFHVTTTAYRRFVSAYGLQEPILAAVSSVSTDQLATLEEAARRIAQLYGQPMDIEWALAEGRFFIVQARPITALPGPAARSSVTLAEAWKLPNPKGHYMRTSVLELLPDPLSPLFATLGLPAWTRATSA